MYVASSGPGRPPTVANFDYEKLSAGHAEACDNESGVELVSVGTPRASTIRIVDPETRVENPAGMVGEIWLHGDNIANGYWRKPQQSQRTFGGQLVDPSAGTPLGPWLRTGDLGVIYDGELFIIGRIKDLLIVDGRNHYPDDIEATTQEISGGRVAAISIPDDRTERLVVIAEMKNRGSSERDAAAASHRETASDVCDFQVARPAGGRSRAGAARLDSDHHQRQDPPFLVSRGVPAGRVQPFGFHRMTLLGDDAEKPRIVGSRRLYIAVRVKPMPSIESSIPAVPRERAGSRDKTG